MFTVAVAFVVIMLCSSLHFHYISSRPIPGVDDFAARVALTDAVGRDLRFARRIGACAFWIGAGISVTVLLFFHQQHPQWFRSPYAPEANILLFASLASFLLAFAFEAALDWKIWRKLADQPQLHPYRRRFGWNRTAFYLAAFGILALVMNGI